MAASPLVTNRSTLLCPHGGVVSFTPMGAGRPVQPGGGIPVVMTDVFVVAGCPCMLGATPSPCTRVQWVSGNYDPLINGVPTLTVASVGLCLSATGAPQGPVIVARAC
ncbi:MAG: hypothetical protein U0529_22645 [Thermoanaerobaculia bacterium]